MSPFNPNTLIEMLENVGNHYLCPNRVWRACSQIKDWAARQSMLREILSGIFPRDALQHEDHSACTIDFCKFSSRDFTAVQQYHEPQLYEEGTQADVAEAHKKKENCSCIRGLFNELPLVQAVSSNNPTAWSLDGWSILEHPRPFMAISHVWSDGTGAGTSPSKQVNECLYYYFKQIARRFQCEGIWWDALCIPHNKAARSRALKAMHRNYEYARITLVHDRFLRNIPFDGPDMACLAIVLSSWFSRGWTALELAKSRKVKIIFKNSIKDLDNDILQSAQENSPIAQAIRDLRRNRPYNVEELLSTLGLRYTSWSEDRATIAGLLAGVEIPNIRKGTFQQDIYQNILKKMGEISHAYLFHNSATMTKGFSWCPTDLFHLPHATTQQKLRINYIGEVSGPWGLLSRDQFDLRNFLWNSPHELIRAKLRYALEKESSRHVLLVIPPENEPSGESTSEIKQGIIVKVLKNPSQGKPRFKCQFVGSLYFLTLGGIDLITREITIGDTEGWEELNGDEDAWHIMEKENPLSSEVRIDDVERRHESQMTKPETEPKWTALHRAAWLGDVCTPEIIASNLDRFQKGDDLGRQAIHLAAERGHKEFIKLLLDKNDDPNSPIDSNGPDNGQTPLHCAAWGGSLEVVELLLAGGSDATITDKTGNTALHIAADMGFEKVVERLCERIPVEARGRNGLTPLHYAVLGGHHEVVKLLVARKAPVNVKDRKFGVTPLHCAAESGQTSVIDLLLGEGARLDETDNKVGWTPLHFAAMNGHNEAVERLVSKANIDQEDSMGFTPLTFAVINGRLPVFETLFRHGANLDSGIFHWPSDAMENPLRYRGSFTSALPSCQRSRIYLAALDKWTSTIRLVADSDADISLESLSSIDNFREERVALLKLAAQDGRPDAVRFLIEIHETYNLDETDYWTIIECAVKNGHGDVGRVVIENMELGVLKEMIESAVWNGKNDVRVLLQTGALEMLGPRGGAILMNAVKRRDNGVVQALLEAGANTEHTDHRGWTPLWYAVHKGRKDVLQTLLRAGANVEALGDQGRTPLLQAIAESDIDIIRILLDAGANPNVYSDKSDPALSTALARLDREDPDTIIEMFLKAGANIEAVNSWGDTALLIAARYRPESVVQALIRAGANREAKSKSGKTVLDFIIRRGLEGCD